MFDVACQMVEQCPALKKRIKPIISQKRLVYLPLNSFYQVLSAESYTKHGLNVHGVIFDELHAQPNRALYDVSEDQKDIVLEIDGQQFARLIMPKLNKEYKRNGIALREV